MKVTAHIVKEKSYGLTHEVLIGAPCQWSKDRGATHTLLTRDGTRPAKLLKTVLYVGIDEDPTDTIVWEKWEVSHYQIWHDVNLSDMCAWTIQTRTNKPLVLNALF